MKYLNLKISARSFSKNILSIVNCCRHGLEQCHRCWGLSTLPSSWSQGHRHLTRYRRTEDLILACQPKNRQNLIHRGPVFNETTPPYIFSLTLTYKVMHFIFFFKYLEYGTQEDKGKVFGYFEQKYPDFEMPQLICLLNTTCWCSRHATVRVWRW